MVQFVFGMLIAIFSLLTSVLPPQWYPPTCMMIQRLGHVHSRLLNEYYGNYNDTHNAHIVYNLCTASGGGLR